jgi:hypothetical protein
MLFVQFLSIMTVCVAQIPANRERGRHFRGVGLLSRGVSQYPQASPLAADAFSQKCVPALGRSVCQSYPLRASFAQFFVLIFFFATTEASNLQLSIPGKYRSNSDMVRIARFSADLQVISSKQRPRRLTLLGTDGQNYGYLLKANEDLRQDVRVIQLFGLINRLFREDYTARQLHLGIQVGCLLWVGFLVFLLAGFFADILRVATGGESGSD